MSILLNAIFFKNHDLDVMWKECKGFHLSQTPSRINHISSELKRARFFRDIFSFDSVISIEAARLALTVVVNPSRTVG
jgi:hypothetical protein